MRTFDDTFGCVDFEGDFIENSPTWRDLLGDDCEEYRISADEFNQFIAEYNKEHKGGLTLCTETKEN